VHLREKKAQVGADADDKTHFWAVHLESAAVTDDQRERHRGPASGAACSEDILCGSHPRDPRAQKRLLRYGRMNTFPLRRVNIRAKIHISMTLQRQADANSEHRDSHLSPEMVCFPGEL
jgi:hypothetical protein